MARQKQSVRSREVGKPQSVVFSRFDGVNNSDPRDKLKPTELSAATNIDLDRLGYPSVRPGRTVVISGARHSLYSNGDTMFAVRAGDLVTVDVVDDTETVLRRGVGDNPMSYDTDGTYTFYSNGSVIGNVVNGVDYSFYAPTRSQKTQPLPGQIVAWYNGSLYVCRDNEIWMSDPLLYNEVDMVNGIFPLPARITMFCPLDDGIFFSTTEKVYYADNGGLDAANLREISNYPNLTGAFTYVDSRLFGGRKTDSMYGRTIVFPTTAGLAWATNGGVFGNITGRRYTLPTGNKGAGLFRTGNINQAVFTVY